MSKEKEQGDKDVAVTEEKPVARTSGGNGLAAGFDEVDDQKDIIMPRLAVLQGLSGMVNDGKGAMGDIANSLTKENFGKEVEFIPLFLFKTRVQFEQGRGLVMLSRDNFTVTFAKDEFEEFIGRDCDEVPGSSWEGKIPPKFHEVFNFPVLLVGREKEFPLCLSMMRTAAKAAREFISMARTANEDFFARIYKVTTRVEKGDKGTYAVPSIELVGRASDEQYETALAQYKMIYKRKEDISVDIEEEPLADPDAV